MSEEKTLGDLPAEEWDGRRRQTGMEAKWEKWVLETLNFLMAVDIPVYRKDGFGRKVPGGDMDIPSRLKAALKKFEEIGRDCAKAETYLMKEEFDHRKTKAQLTRGEDLLERIFKAWQEGGIVGALEVMETLKEYMDRRRPDLFEEKTDE